MKPEIKLSYITGLRDIVIEEIGQKGNHRFLREDGDAVYLGYAQEVEEAVDEIRNDIKGEIRNLRSVARAYVVVQDSKYNPAYISGHKSIVGNLIEMVLAGNGDEFKTFKITCAGSDSAEVRAIREYVRDTYQIVEKEEADLKIHIIKIGEVWEVGIQITPRPLSVRDYKAVNMSGAMDSTIAYAMNSLCVSDEAKTYLNVCSGSATLLIEAGQCHPNLEELVGFDNDKKHLSLAVQNIKKAGLIRKIKVKEGNIFDKPDFGVFDVITSDLPFGMSISKNEDLNKLYKIFIEYCQETLNPDGTLAVYTSEHEILEKIIRGSKFTIRKTLDLKFITSANAYLRPKIFVCTLG